MNYIRYRILFRGSVLSFELGIDLATGQIEVLVTNAELIDWLRGAQIRFLAWGNNGLARSIGNRAVRLGASPNRFNVPHNTRANAISPMTSFWLGEILFS